MLTDSFVIGEGLNKRTYVDPRDSARCIKILLAHPGDSNDIVRELAYRKSRQRRNLPNRLMPAYYGTVETSKGRGYVFERVSDYDGVTSQTLKTFLERLGAEPSLCSPAWLVSLLRGFREDLLREKLITNVMTTPNFCVQRLSPETATIRVIDDVGRPAWFPLAYYIDWIAERHVRRYWGKFVQRMGDEHPSVLTPSMLRELQE